MKDFLKKYKIELILLSYAAIVFMVFKFVFFPFMLKIEEKSDEIQARKIDNQMTQGRIEKIPEMEADWEKCQRNKNSLEVVLARDGEVDFIKKLESIAEATGNRINLKVLEKLDGKDAQRAKRVAEKKEDGEKLIRDSLGYENYITLEINLKGGYSNLAEFIKKVENDKHYVNIISISSKKVLEEEEGLVSSSSGDVFFGQESEVKEADSKGKEVISSVLEVIVYVEK